MPGKEEFYETLRYFGERLKQTGVTVKLGQRVSADELVQAGFKQVVLATGISPRLPEIEGVHHPKVLGYLDVLRKADKTFRVRSDQLQTAVNNDGFEVDLIRRTAVDADPHPLKMSDAEEDLWAVQISSGNRLVSSRRFAQTVVSARGDMALMRTVHPLDFIQVKRALARSPARDPLKARKDALQAEVVQYLWQTYLQYQDTTTHADMPLA